MFNAKAVLSLARKFDPKIKYQIIFELVKYILISNHKICN